MDLIKRIKLFGHDEELPIESIEYTYPIRMTNGDDITYHKTFEDAIKAVPTEGVTTITMLQDYVINSQGVDILKGQTVQLNLNGHNLCAGADLTYGWGLIDIHHGGSLTILPGEGTINAISAGGRIAAAITLIATQSDTDDSEPAVFHMQGGRIIGDAFGITNQGRKTAGNTKVTIDAGLIEAIGTHDDGIGLYLPGLNSEVTINGGIIKGSTAVECRGGNITINDGILYGYGVKETDNIYSNSRGSGSSGCGVAVLQHTHKGALNVTINGGFIYAQLPFGEGNPEKNSAEDIANVNILITGGRFSPINGSATSVYSEDKESFITGGTFVTEPDSKYKAG